MPSACYCKVNGGHFQCNTLRTLDRKSTIYVVGFDRHQRHINKFEKGAIMLQLLQHAPIRIAIDKTINSLHEGGCAKTLKKIYRKIGRIRIFSEEYSVYSRLEMKSQRKTVLPEKIRFSVVVPLYNTQPKYLREMINSVLNQTYPYWELCMADGSDDEHSEVEEICRKYVAKDNRIKYKKLTVNYGISGNTNVALDMAEGDYIALLDHDDIIHGSALFAIAEEIINKGADFIYTDEAEFVTVLKRIYIPHYKPDYAPDTLRGINYICHFTVFKRELLRKTGGFCSEFDGSQDYDMILKLTEHAERIVHIPRILYYWRGIPGSAALDVNAKPYATLAGIAALKGHLERIGLEGDVMQASRPTMYRIRYKLNGKPLVSIIIPNKDNKDILESCINSIMNKSSYSNWEIIIVENGSVESETFEYYEELKKDDRISVVNWGGGFNYPLINNFGVGFARGEYYLLLNNDTEVIAPEWIEEMLMLAQREEVGVVGAKLYYPNGKIQHAGIGIKFPGLADCYHINCERDDAGYDGRLSFVQNFTAVTGACMMIPRNVWDEVGGLDEKLPVAFNDIDICMRVRKKGYLVTWTPFAELYHYESYTRGYEDTTEKKSRFKKERNFFISRWEKELKAGDPYYNPNFAAGGFNFRCGSSCGVRKRINNKEDESISHRC